MKAYCISLSVAALAAAEHVDTKPKDGTGLLAVFMVNAPGLSTPEKNLNLAADPADEAQSLNSLSPMGKRQ